MAILRKQTRCLLSPQDFSPSQADLKVLGVFNPGAVLFNNKILLLARVAEAAIISKDGYVASPRLNLDHSIGRDRYTIDWFQVPHVDDPRKPLLPNGLRRLSSISHLEIVECDRTTGEVLSIRTSADLFPREAWESYGIEDARICPVGEEYVITYTTVSPYGVASAAMTTSDFKSFKRLGIIFPPENKNVVIWQYEQDYYYALHRPTGFTPITRAGVWLSQSSNLTAWSHHQFLFGPTDRAWESGKVGIATPPIAIDEGLLLLYHAVEYRDADDLISIYRIGGLILDKNSPQTILGRSKVPLIEPETDFETRGFVPNVVFATGVVFDNEKPDLQIFYGAADTSVGVLSLPIKNMVESILLH